MKLKLFLLLFFITSTSAFAQEYIFGKVSAETAEKLPNVVVYNIRSGEKALSDREGHFMLAAQTGDEVRFVKSGYDRVDVHLTRKNFSEPLVIALERVPYTIPEVEIAFRATGDLKKDVRLLDPPKKVVALNSNLQTYMKTPFSEPLPKLTVPSAFTPQGVNAIQVDPFALIAAAVKLIRKTQEPAQTTANYAETQQFFREVKQKVNFQYYIDRGWTDENIDRFLIYADATFSLAKKYRKNFNTAAIEGELLQAYKDYSKNHK